MFQCHEGELQFIRRVRTIFTKTIVVNEFEKKSRNTDDFIFKSMTENTVKVLMLPFLYVAHKTVS